MSRRREVPDRLVFDPDMVFDAATLMFHNSASRISYLVRP